MLAVNLKARNLTTDMPVTCPRFWLKILKFGGQNTGVPGVNILAFKLLLEVGFDLHLQVVSEFSRAWMI